jgi:hypothetical protein
MRLLVVMVSVALCATLARAGTLDELASLAGIKGVHVVSEEVKDPGAGVSKQGLEAEIEVQLRRGKVPVIVPTTLEEQVTCLHLQLTTVRTNTGGLAYSITLCFCQPVAIPRLNNINVAATTWSVGGVGTYNDVGFLKRDIAEKVTQFINDFHKAQSLAPSRELPPPGGAEGSDGLVFPGTKPEPNENPAAVWLEVQKLYPGVDVQEIWKKSLADATAVIGADNPKLRELASKYFHERALAATPAKVPVPTVPTPSR